MTKGYVVFTEAIHDQEALDAYTGAATPTVLAAGARPLIIGPPAEVTEGEWHGDVTVILEFESLDAAVAWYRSDEYQAVIPQRHAAADSNVAIFSGFDFGDVAE